MRPLRRLRFSENEASWRLFEVEAELLSVRGGGRVVEVERDLTLWLVCCALTLRAIVSSSESGGEGGLGSRGGGSVGRLITRGTSLEWTPPEWTAERAEVVTGAV